MSKSKRVIEAIQRLYPSIEGGFAYWEANKDGSPLDNEIDGLVWENSEYPKPSWAAIEGKLPTVDLQNSVDAKLAELEDYHNSEAARAVKIGAHTILNNFEFRALIDEQKDRFAEKISLGLTAEEDAVFNYQYNGSGLIPITYAQLRLLSVALKDLADANYNVRVAHRNAIKALTSIDGEDGVEAYDFPLNYVINQTLSL